MAIYVVQAGDTVEEIARRYGINLDTVIYWNQLTYPYVLAVGQALYLRQEQEVAGEAPLLSTGYAYPFIQELIYQETLPYLSQIYIFSYGFTEQGMLIPPMLSDEGMITQAGWFGVEPILTLTPLDAQGLFNNNLISAIVQSEDARSLLIQNLLLVMEEKGYRGIDIDFEYIKAEDRDAFTEFVRVLTARMNEQGYQVTVALAPKTSADQQGLLYQGKDYAGLGAAANRVLLMTYEWGYTYGPPMAVAPLDKVRQVVEYAVTEIPVEKINLGIPNYGYDWPLPYERGVTRARTIGNVEAVQIAVAQGASIGYDETAQSPYFNYIEEGVAHEVWFEDARSIQATFDLIKEFGIQGVGYWQLMRLFRANWGLMEENFTILS